MKLGIFSGTFDPVHDGHIWLARTAFEHYNLDKIALLPEPEPRHKTPTASYKHRRAMLRIASSDHKGLDVLDIPTKKHSVKTTLDFINQHYDDVKAIKLIMGAEVFKSVGKWDDFERLREQAGFIVCLRSEADREGVNIQASGLKLDTEIVSSNFPLISSSQIRKELAGDIKPESLDAKVYEYIRDNGLYGTNEE